MSALEKLAECAGGWTGTNRLSDPSMNVSDDSPSTAELTPLLDGKFIRLDYTWAYEGAAQEGSLLIGYESAPAIVTAHWVDTWHMGEAVMSCKGTAEDDGSVVVLGSYAAPPGPDWGWRIVLQPVDGTTLRLVMYNISPPMGKRSWPWRPTTGEQRTESTSGRLQVRRFTGASWRAVRRALSPPFLSGSLRARRKVSVQIFGLLGTGRL